MSGSEVLGVLRAAAHFLEPQAGHALHLRDRAEEFAPRSRVELQVRLQEPPYPRSELRVIPLARDRWTSALSESPARALSRWACPPCGSGCELVFELISNQG